MEMVIDNLTDQFRPVADEVCKRRGIRLLTTDEFEIHHGENKRRQRAILSQEIGTECARGCIDEATSNYFWWLLLRQNYLYYTDSIYVGFSYHYENLNSRYSITIYEFCLNEPLEIDDESK